MNYVVSQSASWKLEMSSRALVPSYFFVLLLCIGSGSSYLPPDPEANYGPVSKDYTCYTYSY